jgi:hypothetical protein
MTDMPDIIAIDPAALLKLVLIVAIEVIGIMEFLKNFFKHRGDRTLAFTTLLVTALCAYVNSCLVDPLYTALFDTMFLGLAITQIGYDAIMKGIPNMINKAMGGGNNAEVSGTNISLSNSQQYRDTDPAMDGPKGKAKVDRQGRSTI